VFKKVAQWFILAMIVSGVTFLSFKNNSTSPVKESANVTEEQASASLPVRLQIPSLNVDAEVESVGIAADGTMETPSLPLKTAWYNLGAKPGEKGSAVIDGHVNWENGSKGVFKDLHDIKPESLILVTDDRGNTHAFIVTRVATYDYKADATEIFTSKDDRAHLNLITCIGAWDKSKQSYTQRFIVFADLE
jgi:sortase (surface protein transpeptidase)